MIDHAPDDRSGTNLELKASIRELGEARERVRSFVEFEACLDRIGDRTEADRRIAWLRERLGIVQEDVVNGSYGEMIDAR